MFNVILMLTNLNDGFTAKAHLTTQPYLEVTHRAAGILIFE
jgi:hypothetical protein